MARTASVFPTVRSEGGLLPPDLLQRIVEADAELGGFGPADYGLDEREPVREAIARAWQRVRAYWAAFQAATEDLPETSSGVTETREQWVLPLLRTMGYSDVEFRAAAEEIGGRRYSISHRAGEVVPVHVVSFREDLDRSSRSDDGAARLSPHALVQEYLNRREGHLYGLVTNGRVLRLLRDNFSLTRLAYVEFDLAAMLEGGVYADFVLLWLALHRTRLPQAGAEASQCWLERWRDPTSSSTTRPAAVAPGAGAAVSSAGLGLSRSPVAAGASESPDGSNGHAPAWPTGGSAPSKPTGDNAPPRPTLGGAPAQPPRGSPAAEPPSPVERIVIPSVMAKPAPAAARPSKSVPDGRRVTDGAKAPSPPAQATLPGLSTEQIQLRQRVLKRTLELLAGSGPLTGRDIARHLVQLDLRIDHHLVNSVLAHEGAPDVRYDPAAGKYRLKRG